MKRMAMALGMCLALGSAWAQQQPQQQPQIWRCELDGQVRYTDRPCEKASQPLPARSVQPNGVASAPLPALAAASAAPAPAPELVQVSVAPAAAPSAASDLPPPAAAAEIAEAPCTNEPDAGNPVACRQDSGPSADSGVVMSQPVAAAPARRAYRPPAEWQRPTLHGLLHTDFVQRGYVPRRQNPTSTPSP